MPLFEIETSHISSSHGQTARTLREPLWPRVIRKKSRFG